MDAKSRTLNSLGFAIVLVAMLSHAGCKSPWKTPKMFSLDNTWPFRDKDAPQEGTPVRMVGAWTDTVLTQAKQKPQRGFGGRLMFYEKEGKNPILVEGQLVVYAFDETARDPTDNKPTRRYVFPPEQMPLHMSKSDLGASYSFWLPWDEAGGPKTEVSLVCRFEPKGGPVVTSDQTRHLLPGSAPAIATAGAKKPPKVPEGVPSKPPRQTLESLQTRRTAEQQARLISYEAPVASDQQPSAMVAVPQASAAPEKRLTATTITLPQNFQMPDAAALNLAAAGANYPHGAAPPTQSFVPNQGQWQLPAAPSRTYAPAAMPGPAPVQPVTMTRPVIGIQPAQQPTLNSQPTLFPGQQPMTTAPMGWNNQTTSQMPAHQFPLQAGQQLMAQQPMMQQSMPGQPSMQQLPAQPGVAAAVNYPPQGQLLR